MREQGRARLGSFANDLHRGGLAKRLYADESLRRGLRRIRDGLAGVAETGPRGTTHISVVDSEGNAASLTASTGSGSGVIVPGTGVHLNNMLGEYDLNPAGAEARPGSRLTSMMAPSLVVRRGRPRLVLGSAGSVRLRGAILQAVVNVIDHGLPVEEAIMRRGSTSTSHTSTARAVPRQPRSTGWSNTATRSCAGGGATSTSVASRRSRSGRTARWAAAGDLRRGGHGIVVR